MERLIYRFRKVLKDYSPGLGMYGKATLQVYESMGKLLCRFRRVWKDYSTGLGKYGKVILQV